MLDHHKTPNADAAPIQAICEQAGLRTAGAGLLHQRANAVYHLPHENAIVRCRKTYGATEWHRHLTSAVHVTRWLSRSGLPTTVPLSLEPVTVDGWTATFWHYVPFDPAQAPATSSDLGRLIRRLHDLPTAPVDLPPTNLLGSLPRDLQNAGSVISTEQRRWLEEQASEIGRDCSSASFPLGTGIVHGDAHPGNVFPARNGHVLGDWDSVSTGPKLQDVAPVLNGVHRFGRPASDWTDFCSAYGVDSTISSDPAIQVLCRAREIRSLAAYIRSASRSDRIRDELHKRLRSLMFNEVAVWNAI